MYLQSGNATIAELVEQCKSNSRKAQMELYRLFAPAMFNISYRITGSKAASEDIMQESFITAFDKIENCKTPGLFGAWLKRIVVNRSIDEVRKKKIIFDPIDSVNLAEEEKDDITAEETEKETVETVELIKKSLAMLPDGYRIVLTLKLLEEYSYEEIAKELNITESTVRSQFVRARQRLVELIGTLKKEQK